jgi:hypothetical protein
MRGLTDCGGHMPVKSVAEHPLNKARLAHSRVAHKDDLNVIPYVMMLYVACCFQQPNALLGS